jgi:hypothetical protein
MLRGVEPGSQIRVGGSSATSGGSDGVDTEVVPGAPAPAGAGCTGSALPAAPEFAGTPGSGAGAILLHGLVAARRRADLPVVRRGALLTGRRGAGGPQNAAGRGSESARNLGVGSGVSPEPALAGAAVPSATSNAATARRAAGTRDEAAGGALRGLVRMRSDAPILVPRPGRGNEEAR